MGGKLETWAESRMVCIYDQMVYKLYGLREDEISIVEEDVNGRLKLSHFRS